MTPATPQDLASAVRTGQLARVQTVLATGLGRERPAELGLGLALACFLGFREIVRELVRRGAPLNLPPGLTDASPLAMSVKGGQKKTTRLLISLGAKVPPGMETGLTHEEYAEAVAKARARHRARADRKAQRTAKGSPVAASPKQPAEPPSPASPAPAPKPASPAAAPRAAATPVPATGASAPVAAPAANPVRRSRGGVIEEIELTGCYGVDTNVLEADLMRWNTNEAPRGDTPQREE